MTNLPFPTWPQRVWLELHACPVRLRWQEPAYQDVRWYHLLWFALPLVGILGFFRCVPYRPIQWRDE